MMDECNNFFGSWFSEAAVTNWLKFWLGYSFNVSLFLERNEAPLVRQEGRPLDVVDFITLK